MFNYRKIEVEARLRREAEEFERLRKEEEEASRLLLVGSLLSFMFANQISTHHLLMIHPPTALN